MRIPKQTSALWPCLLCFACPGLAFTIIVSCVTYTATVLIAVVISVVVICGVVIVVVVADFGLIFCTGTAVVIMCIVAVVVIVVMVVLFIYCWGFPFFTMVSPFFLVVNYFSLLDTFSLFWFVEFRLSVSLPSLSFVGPALCSPGLSPLRLVGRC